LKQDLDDIAQGLKIVTTLGNVAKKAAQTLQGTTDVGQNQEQMPKARFCEQCGERVRPGKHFCNNCGARIN
jgi:rRNA maturation endonuclease Nob1